MPESSDHHTVMSEAFARAGHEAPQIRLKRMMREAIKAGDGRLNPSRDYFVAALAKANDAALLWELFANVRAREIFLFFESTLKEMRATGAQPNANGEAGVAMPQGHELGADPLAPSAGEGTKPSLPQGHAQSVSPSAHSADEEAMVVLPKGPGYDASSSAPSVDGEAIHAVPQGQNSLASPSAPYADEEAIRGVPQGHTSSADSSAPNSGESEANVLVPQGHSLTASPPEQQPDNRAKNWMPSGHSVSAPSPAAAPTPREPSQAAIAAMIRVNRRHAAYDFPITIREGEKMAIGDVRVSSYQRMIREMGKRVWIAGQEYNLIRSLKHRVDRLAYVPKEATTRDIFSGYELESYISASKKTGDLPVVIVPKELAAPA